MTSGAGAAMHMDTLVIGAGQAGLATSHWLTKAGVEHLVVDRRDRLGGAWHDRWDGFTWSRPTSASCCRVCRTTDRTRQPAPGGSGR